MGELIKSPAGSADPAKRLASLVLARGFRSESGAAGLVAEAGDDALAILRGFLVPLKDAEPDGSVRDDTAELGFQFSGLTDKLVEALRPIGIKINPTMSASQAGAWMAAMVAALSDLPGRVVIRAALDSVHTPMKFMNEAESIIRERAKTVRAGYDLAIRRIELMQRDMARVARPLPALPPPPAVSQEDVDQMAPHLQNIGELIGALIRNADGSLSPAPALHERSDSDGLPYFCKSCGGSIKAFQNCPRPDCRLESVEEASLRARSAA